MHYRIFDSQNAEYCGHNYFISGDGKVFCLERGVVKPLDQRAFIVEPWTGLFDSKGQKIYLNDIVECESVHHFISKVEWKNGGFHLIPLDEHGLEHTFQYFTLISSIWTVTKNIHNVS